MRIIFFICAFVVLLSVLALSADALKKGKAVGKTSVVVGKGKGGKTSVIVGKTGKTGKKGKGTTTVVLTGKGGKTTTGVLPSNNGNAQIFSSVLSLARSGLVAVTLNNYFLYAIGGNSGNNNAFANVDLYTLKTNTWSSVAPLNTPRNGPGAAALDGLLYVFSGEAPALDVVNTMEVYTPSLNRWVYGPNLTNARWNLGGIALCNLIYAIGGFQYTGSSGTTLFVSATNFVEVFDPAVGSWSSSYPQLPEFRAAFGIVVINNEIYVIGGETNFARGTTQTPTTGVLIYNPTTGWRNGTSIIDPRVGFGAAVVDNKIFIGGGRSTSGQIITNVEVFDPVTGVWSQSIYNFPTPRFNNAAGALFNELFVIGGRTSNNNINSFTASVEAQTVV
jgi:N-acetylneuraminic acid mutarotase